MVTNNASRTSDYYVKRLGSYGVEIAAQEVITSAQAPASYLAERSEPGTPVYYIGEDGLGRALCESKFALVDDNATPKYVVVGWDRELTYAKLAQATVYIFDGATFVATNPDKTWPSERGQLPGAGAILAGGALLLVTRVASWRTVVSVLGSFALVGGVLHWALPGMFAPVHWHLLAGGLLFGAFFMATDPVTSPATAGGKWAYGILIGAVTVLIRHLAGTPEGVMFAILLGNVAAPVLDEVAVRVRLRRLRNER